MAQSSGGRPYADDRYRRFLTAAEAITLLGMVVSVFSLFFTWKRYVPEIAPLPLPGALFRSPNAAHLVVLRTGFTAGVQWPITVCAVLAGATLMVSPTDAASKAAFAVFQGACGAAILVTGLAHFAPLPGVALAILGGLLLLAGAVQRSGPGARS